MAYASNLSAYGLVGPSGLKPDDVRDIAPHTIRVGKRHRNLDENKVKELAQSFLDHSQKQPIGVRRHLLPNGIQDGYDLIYGAHRLAALRLLEAEGKELHPHVWAIIYPADYPDIAVQMDELVENLHRLDLTPAEKAAHQTIYAGLLKKSRKVQTAREQKAGRPKLGDPKLSEYSKDTHLSSLPTVTEKLVADTGVARNAVINRHKTAVKLAEREGVVIQGPKTVELMDGDTLVKVGEAAAVAAAKKIEKARETGEREFHTDPVKPRKPTQRHVTLDVVNLPEALEKWCRARLADKSLNIPVLEKTVEMLTSLLNDVSIYK